MAYLVLFLGITALVQHFYYQHHPVVAIFGDGFKMRVNTALMIILGGISVLLLHYGLRLPARLIAGCVLVLSSLTLLEHICNINLGIDGWLYTGAQLGTATEPTGRTSFLAAVISALLSTGMLLLSLKKYTVAQLLAFISLTLM
ncbi:MAG: hypothetical protein EOP45_17175, partial [Sphingobacteriaceae bacterium]